MDNKTKRKAMAAFRILQNFASICFEAKNILSSSGFSQEEKIQVLKRFSVFLITRDALFSVSYAQKLLKSLVTQENGVLRVEMLPAISNVIDVASLVETDLATLTGYFKKSIYNEITNFEGIISISNHYEANSNDYFDESQTTRFNNVCEAINDFIGPFYDRASLISGILGQVLLDI